VLQQPKAVVVDSLGNVFIFCRYRRYGFADIAHFALSEERLVLDRFTVCPRRVFSGHHGNDTGQELGFFGVDFCNSGVRPRAKQCFAVEHIGQDKVIAINNLTRDFFVGIDSGDWFSDDCEFRHGFPLRVQG